MSFKRFIEWYPKYKSFNGNVTTMEIYDFLATPVSIDNMETATKNNRPALAGVVRDIEANFSARTDLDLSNNVVKQMVGSMIKEILSDFGYSPKIQRVISESTFFSSATYYEYDSSKATKRIERSPVIVDVL